MAKTIVKAKFSQRLFASLINFAIFFLLAVCIDRMVMPYTYKAWTNSEELTSEFIELNEEYKSLQDHYNIYVYDENSSRIQNTSENSLNEQEFLSNPRVIELKKEIPEIEKKMLTIDITSFVISYFVSSFGVMILLSFVLGRGTSLGGLILGIRYVDNFGEKPTKIIVLKYDLLSFLFHYVLSIISIGILPSILLYQIYYNEKSQSLIEKWLNIQYIIK